MNFIIILWFMIAFIAFILLIGIAYTIYFFRVFKYKIELFENLGGIRYERTKVFRARLLNKPGGMGEKVLWIPKIKEYCSPYGQKMGKNTYWEVVGPDGHWYNATLGDFDAKMGMLDVEPIDTDVKGFYINNRANIEERYKSPKNWPTILMSFTIILALIIVFTGGYVMYKQVEKNQAATAGNLQASAAATEAAAKVLEGIDNLVRGGQIRPGIVPVNITTNG